MRGHRWRRRIPYGIRDAICREYPDPNTSSCRLAIKYGVHPDTVLKILRQEGVPIRRRGHPPGRTRRVASSGWNRVSVPAETEQALCAAYESDRLTGMQSLGIRFGLSRTVVKRVLREHRVLLRRPGSQPGRPAAHFKGGRYVTPDGYVMTLRPEHPAAVKGYVLEHRLVMEAALGRYLLPTEEVHHKNRVRWDNDPGNLMVMTRSAHRRHHAQGRPRKPKITCSECGQVAKHGAHGLCERCYARLHGRDYRKRRVPRVCGECGRLAVIAADGLCGACYQRQRRAHGSQIVSALS